MIVTEHLDPGFLSDRRPSDTDFHKSCLEPRSTTGAARRRASMEDSVFADDVEPLTTFVHRRPPRYTGINLYNRPSSTSSSANQSSPSSAEQASKRLTLFGSFK